MNDFFDITKNTNRSDIDGADGFGELDSLFSDARQGQPSLTDSNFSKCVVNSLPAKPARRRSRQGWSYDLVGVLIGLTWAYFYFDANQFLGGLFDLVPETITLLPVHALAALGAVSLMSFIAWWSVENSPSL